MTARHFLLFKRLYSTGVLEGVVQKKQYVKSELIKQLTKLREKVGETQQKSPKTVLNDKDIYNIADKLPNTLNELKQIKNIGDQKVKLVGKDVINIIKNFEKQSNKLESNSKIQAQQILPEERQQSKNQKLEEDLRCQKDTNNQKFQDYNYQLQEPNDEIINQNYYENSKRDGIGLPNQNLNLENTKNKEKFQFNLQSLQNKLDNHKETTHAQKNIEISTQIINNNSKQNNNFKLDYNNNKNKTENICTFQQISQKQTDQMNNQKEEAQKMSKADQQAQKTELSQKFDTTKNGNQNFGTYQGFSNINNSEYYYSPRIEFQDGDSVLKKKQQQNQNFLGSIISSFNQMVKKFTG